MVLHAILLCSDEACAVELEAWGEPDELDLTVCDACGCVLQVLALAEAELPRPASRVLLREAA